MKNGRRYLTTVSHRLMLAAIATSGLFGLVSPATAQDTDEQAIIVTGSRIHTDPLTNRQPVTQLGQEDIARTGLSATADVLQRLPVSGGGLNTRNNNSGNIGNPPDGGGVGAGAAEIDLRFLGARRVLVLVDGQRWVAGTAGSGIPGSVDLNTIPSSMIDHIEVLQESASPIYGSDAIAGVVNIITRRQQDGLDAYAQAGGYVEEGDGFTQDYGANWGWSGANSHFVVGANYTRQELVSSADRELSAFPAPYATSCLAGGCSSGAANGRFVITDPNTLNSLNLTVGNVGATPLYNPAAPNVVSGSNTFRSFTTLDRFNFGPSNYLLTPSERIGAFASWEQEFANDVTFRLRVSYADRKSANQAAPLPLFIGQDAGNGTILDDTVVSATNPYNPFGFALNTSTYSFIGRRMVEAGPRHFEQDVETWDVAAMLDGQWELFGNTWYWDANASWGQNSAEQAFTGDINVARVQQALGPAAGCTGACVPLNLFGGAGTITPAMLGWIGYTEHNSSESELTDFTFNVTGDLMQMPAGALAIAGIEALYYFMPRLTADGHVAAFDLAGHGHLANWLASAVLLVSSLASLLIYSIRRDKADDYHGRYRIWLWAAAVWLVMSVDETAGLHHGFQGLMVGLTGTRIAGDGALWWMLPYGLILLAIGGRLVFEIMACRTAVAFYALAGLTLAAAVAVHLDSIPYPLPVEHLVMLEEGLELAGDWCLLVSLALFARFTILEAEGGLRHSAKAKRSKQKSAEGRRARDANGDTDDESQSRSRTQASATGAQLRFDSAQSHGPSDHRRLSKAERRALKRERLRERD